MDKLHWQQLAERWLVDAKAQLDAHGWSAAYYLAGYAVECALKACILKRVAATPGLIFDERRFSEKCWTHQLKELVLLAGLEADHKAQLAENLAFQENWRIVKDWSELSRYRTTSHHKAKRLYQAITNDPDGVMSWIKARW